MCPSDGGLHNVGSQGPFGVNLFRALKVETFSLDCPDEFANLNEKACARFVNHYQDMSEAAPFALRLRNTNIYQLLSNSPMLLLSVILTASSSNANLQHQADRIFLQVLADRVMVQGQKTLEILQSLLTYLNWYHLRFDPRKQQFYQFVQLANGMAADLSLPRVFSHIPEIPVFTDQVVDQARAFLLCYYLNVGGSALGFDRSETMQCSSSLRGAAQLLARVSESPLDRDIPAMLGLMEIASCHQKEMREPKDDDQCLCDLEKLRESLCGWATSVDLTSSAITRSMLAPTCHFITAYTFLKSRNLRQTGSPALGIGLEACQAVLSRILDKRPCHLVKLSIVEWAHLITTLFILPWLEISATRDRSMDSASVYTPSTLHYTTAFRSQLEGLKHRSEKETIFKAETLFGWLETILMAVDTRATKLSDRFLNRVPEEETAFELVNSFLEKEMTGHVGSLVDLHSRSKEDAWLEFMSDWLDW